jgi:hypothetical protein
MKMTDVQNCSAPKLSKGRLFDPAHRCSVRLSFFKNTKGELVHYFNLPGQNQAIYCFNVELSNAGFPLKRPVFIEIYDSRVNPPDSKISFEHYGGGTEITKFVDFTELERRQHDIEFVKRYCLDEIYDCLKRVLLHEKLDASAADSAYQRSLDNNIEIDRAVMVAKKSPNGMRTAQLYYSYRNEQVEFRFNIKNQSNESEEVITFLKDRGPLKDWTTYHYCTNFVWIGNKFLRLDGRGSGIKIYIPIDDGEIDFSEFERWFIPKKFPERGYIRHFDSMAKLRKPMVPHNWVRLRTINDVKSNRAFKTFGEVPLTISDLEC